MEIPQLCIFGIMFMLVNYFVLYSPFFDYQKSTSLRPLVTIVNTDVIGF